MKKFAALLIALLMTLSFTLAFADEAPAAEAPKAEKPILVTSGGQSADFQMVATLMGKVGLECTVNNLATSADLAGMKTVVVVVGGSSKGLGAAGIDANGELARLVELLDAAKAQGMTIIVMHTGGSARRGDLSDKFISPVFAYANHAIVVAEGDSDGLISGVCTANNIPLDSITGIKEVATVLPALF